MWSARYVRAGRWIRTTASLRGLLKWTSLSGLLFPPDDAELGSMGLLFPWIGCWGEVRGCWTTLENAEFNIMEVNGDQQEEWWMNQTGHKLDCNRLTGRTKRRGQERGQQTLGTLVVKGKSETGQLLDWGVWLTGVCGWQGCVADGVYGWLNLIGS